MDKLTLNNIHAFDNSLLQEKKNYLVLQNIQRIPPHIGLVIQNKYYSTAVAGVKTNLPFETVLKNIYQKNIPTLILELDEIAISEEKLTEIFENYGPLNAPEKSCLFPIMDVLSIAFQKDFTAEFVFELIPVLNEMKKLKRIYSLHLSSSYPHDFRLKEYSRNEINYCIDQLNAKEKVG